MTGKIADPGEDVMPWFEVTDSVNHRNDLSSFRE